MTLQVFKNNQFGEVRVIDFNNAPWFVAKDVCEILEHTNTTVALQMLEEDERTKLSLGRQGDTNIISESGLYTLILRSNKPQARSFRKWVTSEVLPSIRKNGGYIANQENLTDTELMAKALIYAQTVIENRNKQIETMRPKAEFYDQVAGSKDAIDIGTVAKVLGIRGLGRNNLFEKLRELKILMPNNQPYQKYIDRGYFRTIEQKYLKHDGSISINIKTLVYQKGLDYIRRMVS